MPIWLELIVLMLASYATGMAAGWMLWARGDDVGRHHVVKPINQED